MSIFGMMDADKIPTNPFWIKCGEYFGEVVTSELRENSNNENKSRMFFLEYKIESEGGFKGRRAQHRLPLPAADFTEEDMALLSEEDQAKVMRQISTAKRVLCGDGYRKGLGVPVESLNDPEWDPAEILTRKVNFLIDNYGDDNNGVQIKWVELDEDANR